VLASMLSLIIVLAFLAKKSGRWRSFFLACAGLVLFAFFLNRILNFPFKPATAKGPQDLVLAFALYVCMLAGIIAQFLYRRFERPQPKRPAWDWGLFLAPVFASPIVFIPLLAAFQTSEVKLEQLTAPRLMVFFVAFQNGFFWKEFFDRQQQKAGKS